MSSKTKEVGIRLSVKDKDVAERALKAFGAEGEAAFKRIMRSAEPATTSLTALNAATGKGRAILANFSAGAVATVASTLSLSAAVAGAKAALDDFGKIADAAASTGLDPEFFQGLAHAANLAGVETEGLAASLAGYAKNAGLAAHGKGELVEKLKALNPELLRNIQLATSQEERIRLAADALDQTSAAADRAALASALFGDQGVKLAAAFEGGANALDATVAKAKELGLVIDRETIAKADDLGDKFETATKIVDLRLKQALVNLAPLMVNLANLTADWSNSLAIVLDQLNAVEDRKFVRPLQNQMAGLMNQRLSLLEQIGKLEKENWGLGEGWREGTIDTLKDRAEGLYGQINELFNRITELQGRNGSVAPAGKIDLPDVPASSLQTVDKLAGKIAQVKVDATSISSEIVRGAEQWGEQLGDALGGAFANGKVEWNDLFRIILADVGKLATQQLISKPLGGLFGSIASTLFGGPAGTVAGMIPGLGAIPSAKGNVFSGAGISAHSGTVVNRPTYFPLDMPAIPFARGAGLMGEAGPEAIIPLKRGADGRLGVSGGKSATLNVTINNNIAGSPNMSPSQLRAVLEQNNKVILDAVPDAWLKAYRSGRFG